MKPEWPDAHAIDPSQDRPLNVPMPSRPDPGVTEYGGKVACNEPLRVNGVVVGYCGKYEKPHKRKPHRGPHSIEWWSS